MEIKTNKGNAMPLCDGFLMCKDKVSRDGLRQLWQCKDKFSGCKGRAVSAIGSLVLTQTQAHDSHGASPAEKKERLTLVKNLAGQSLATSSQEILTAAKMGLSEEEIGAMPKDINIKRLVANVRKPKGAANVDKNLVDMVLGNDFKTTTRGGRFLLYDSRGLEPNKPVILIFASDRGLDFLIENNRWSIDGMQFIQQILCAGLDRPRWKIQNAKYSSLYRTTLTLMFFCVSPCNFFIEFSTIWPSSTFRLLMNRSEEDDNEVELVAPMDANFIFDANLNLFRRI